MLQATWRALDLWIVKKYRAPNWWHNDIGTPMQMRDIILLLDDRLTGERRAGALEILNQFGRPKPQQAANTVWEAQLGMEYGALTGDARMVHQYAAMIAGEVHIGGTQGIQSDFSFYQHGPRLQQLSYGGAFIQDTSRAAWQLSGTPWAFAPDKMNLLVSKILEADQWMMRGSFTVPSALDRQSCRPNSLKTHAAQTAAQYLLDADAPRKDELAAFIARSDGKAPPLVGFRTFPRSDFVSYQREKFAAFVKTPSLRTGTVEIGLNGENLLGHLMDCGDLYLLRNGEEYHNLQPVWDWDHLPGVTWAKDAGVLQQQEFAGGTGDGTSGVVAMDYRFGPKAHGGEPAPAAKLSARKLWAFHGDLVVCLIGDLHGNAAQTTLDQCRLNGPVNIVTADGATETVPAGDLAPRSMKAVLHNGFAYLPLGDAKVRLQIGEKTGSWRRISKAASDQPVNANVFFAVMEHAPTTAGYVIADVPNPQAAAELANHPTWQILRNDHAAQAVKFADGAVMAAFYEPARAGDIEADRPCIVMVNRNKIHAADPLQHGGELRLTLAQKTTTLQLPADGTSVHQ
jgi:chondroitin AC lyase